MRLCWSIFRSGWLFYAPKLSEWNRKNVDRVLFIAGDRFREGLTMKLIQSAFMWVFHCKQKMGKSLPKTRVWTAFKKEHANQSKATDKPIPGYRKREDYIEENREHRRTRDTQNIHDQHYAVDNHRRIKSATAHTAASVWKVQNVESTGGRRWLKLTCVSDDQMKRSLTVHRRMERRGNLVNIYIHIITWNSDRMTDAL